MPSKPYKTKVYQLSKNTPAAFLHPGVFPHPYLLSSDQPLARYQNKQKICERKCRTGLSFKLFCRITQHGRSCSGNDSCSHIHKRKLVPRWTWTCIKLRHVVVVGRRSSDRSNFPDTWSAGQKVRDDIAQNQFSNYQ